MSDQVHWRGGFGLTFWPLELLVFLHKLQEIYKAGSDMYTSLYLTNKSF